MVILEVLRQVCLYEYCQWYLVLIAPECVINYYYYYDVGGICECRIDHSGIVEGGRIGSGGRDACGRVLGGSSKIHRIL